MKCLKFLVLFHTVTGNNYLMAKHFEASVKECGHDVMLRRIEDATMGNLKDTYEIINEYYDKIMAVEPVRSQELEDKDVIVLGSPTYYGSYSGAMKVFFDSLIECWSGNTLYKKKLMLFTTMGDIDGGGESCLKALITFGNHMGMQFVPISPSMTFEKGFSSYGIKHCVGEFGDQRPPASMKESITKWIRTI